MWLRHSFVLPVVHIRSIKVNLLAVSRGVLRLCSARIHQFKFWPCGGLNRLVDVEVDSHHSVHISIWRP